jgi:hypothetical protein
MIRLSKKPSDFANIRYGDLKLKTINYIIIYNVIIHIITFTSEQK